jgi:phosphoglycolate phosphatase-like HAD superfamily hydrolase
VAEIKAIAFDFDGVVLENAHVKTEAFVELFAEYGAEAQSQVKAHHLDNLGISRFKKFAWIYDNVLHEPLSDEQSKALGERFSALALDKVLAAPFVTGAREALTALVAHYPMFVVSGTPQDELELIVDRRELRSSFREVHGSPREKPAILVDLLDRYQLSCDELLFIGDGISDYKAAGAVGVEFLARDTPDLHDRWVSLKVVLRPDLRTLVEVVRGWGRT